MTVIIFLRNVTKILRNRRNLVSANDSQRCFERQIADYGAAAPYSFNNNKVVILQLIMIGGHAKADQKLDAKDKGNKKEKHENAAVGNSGKCKSVRNHG